MRSSFNYGSEEVLNQDGLLRIAGDMMPDSDAALLRSRRRSRDLPQGRRREAESGLGPQGMPLKMSFLGSGYFWASMATMCLLVVAFGYLTSMLTPGGIRAVLSDPSRLNWFIASLAIIGGVQFMFAVMMHRNSIQQRLLQRVLSVVDRSAERNATSRQVGRSVNSSFDHLLVDLDSRMLELDAKVAAFTTRLKQSNTEISSAAEVSVDQMNKVCEATEIQREGIQRAAAQVSTDVVPVISKLETAVQSLERLAESAGGILGSVGATLQNNTAQLQSCLEAFNRANHQIVPEIDKRIIKVEALLTRLPDEIDTMIKRIDPLSTTISDAALLSTANVDVVEQIARDVVSNLEKTRGALHDFSTLSLNALRQNVEEEAVTFRNLLDGVMEQEIAKIAALSREISSLSVTVTGVVSRLSDPVARVTGSVEHVLQSMSGTLNSLEDNLRQNVQVSLGKIDDAAVRIVKTINRDLESSSLNLQSRIMQSCAEISAQIGADTVRKMDLAISEVANKATLRLSDVLKTLPLHLQRLFEGEIAQVEELLEGKVDAISGQLKQMIDGVPKQVSTVADDALNKIDGSMTLAFEDLKQKSASLESQIRKSAVEANDEIMQNYVDFIFLALQRIRKEMEEVSRSAISAVELEAGRRIESNSPVIQLTDGVQ
jgi:hypothetical protein